MQLEINIKVLGTTSIRFDHCFTSPYFTILAETKKFPEVFNTGFQSLHNSEEKTEWYSRE